MKSVNPRSLVAATHDAVMAALSFVLALYIRLGDGFTLDEEYLQTGVVLFTAICMFSFMAMRLYSGMWRFASMRDMIAIAKAVSLAIALFAVAMFVLYRLEHIPRSVLFINWLLLVWLLAAPRFAYRALKDRSLHWEMTLEEKAKIPVLLVGATSLAEQFIQDMARDPRTLYRAVGIIDGNSAHHERMLHRTRIYGSIAMLPAVLQKLKRRGASPHKILIADPDLRGDDVQLLLRLADAAALPVARIPRLSDFNGHFDAKSTAQPIALEDLLGRAQTVLDRQAMRALVAGKRVLVTGAGGSIGSELARQIAGYDPASLILLDSSEFNLYEIGRQVGKILNNERIVQQLGDVRDRAHMENLFATHAPAIVFHAAAIKHVPLAEENAEEAILTNVMGTRNIADLCLAHKVGAMVLISTDKAVNPTNVMGATKRLAESYCQGAAREAGCATQFVTVRFGNVLGSTGSVVPLFAEQIASGGPVTVTHPEMTRYFMTVREAVELVLQAAAIGLDARDARGHIFVLDMGKPIKILDLANQMIRLAGLKPGEDIAIAFTGVRPGEKLHEALFHDAETLAKTAHASIFLASPRASDYMQLAQALDTLHAHCAARRTREALAQLSDLVPEFNPLAHVA